MTLTTHAITGAAVASFFPTRPMTAFVLAFASHFVLDAIPHRDYPIRSASVNPMIGERMKYDSAFFMDMFSIGGDAMVGILLSFLLFATPATVFAVLIGAFAGILPDPLQFAYSKFKHEPLVSLQKFHLWMHTEKRFASSLFWGIFTQVAFVFAVVGTAEYFLASHLL